MYFITSVIYSTLIRDRPVNLPNGTMVNTDVFELTTTEEVPYVCYLCAFSCACLNEPFVSCQAAAVLVLRSQEDSTRDPSTLGVSHPPPSHPPPPPPAKPRSETTARKTGAGNTGKGQTNQEGEFPCKKCGRSVHSDTLSIYTFTRSKNNNNRLTFVHLFKCTLV